MGLSIWQILIIVLVIVLLFGSRKIPALMRDVGQGMTAFKRGMKTDSDDTPSDDAEEADEAAPAVENQQPASESGGQSKRRSTSRKRSAANG